jgi:hypothetical protein
MAAHNYNQAQFENNWQKHLQNHPDPSVRDRFNTAYKFYTDKEYGGYDHDKALQEMKGINFNRDVSVETIKAGEVFKQYPNKPGEVGPYFTQDSHKSELGIQGDYLGNQNRVLEIYVAENEFKALKSTSADIENWSEAKELNYGGGTQFFVAEKDKHNLGRWDQVSEALPKQKLQEEQLQTIQQQKEQEKVSVTEKNNEIEEQISKYEKERRAYESAKREQIENEVCKQQQAQLIDNGRYKEAWLVRAEELKELNGTYINVAKREGELLATFPDKFDPDFRHSMQERQNLVNLYGLDSPQIKKAFEDEFNKTLINRNDLKEARQAQVEYVLAKEESEKIKTEHPQETLPSVIIEQNQQRMTNATQQVVSAYQTVQLTHELEQSIQQQHKNYYSQSL